MPRAHITLEEVDQSILRPVVIDMVSQIKSITGIPKSVPIYFPGDIGVVAPPGTEIESTDKENTVLFATQKAVRIEVEQDYDLDYVLSTDVGPNASSACFFDKEHDVMLVPIYVKSEVTIHFKYSTHSKTEAFRWREEMRLNASKGRDINIHTLNYHYLIPTPYLLLLKDVYDKKEKILPTNETFNQYLIRCMSTRLVVLTDQAKTDYRYAIKEQQHRIQGLYEFGYIPQKPNKNDDSGTWTIEFDYKFNYERPAFMLAVYPVMVRQQLLGMKYFDHITTKPIIPDNPDDINHSGYRAATSYFENINTNPVTIGAMHIPEHDVFIPTTKLSYTEPVLTVLVSLSEADKRSLFNLKELGDLILDKTVVELLESGDSSKLCKPYQTLYTAHLYENNTLMPVNYLHCDSSLNLTSNFDLDLRKIYRVVITVNTHLGMINPVSIQRLESRPDAVTKYIELAYNSLYDISQTTSIPIKTKSDINLVYWLLTGKNLFFDPKDLSDHPSSIPEFIISRTRLSKEMKEFLLVSNTGILKSTTKELEIKYGSMNSQYLLNLRSQLTVTPRVVRTCIFATRKQP